MKKYQVLIVGGGAAGCIAALKLKEAGLDTAIIEGGDRLLKKLLVTGNGRCNITNRALIGTSDVSPFYSCDDPTFRFDPLVNHGAESAIAFFSELGLPLTTLEDGKMYPKSLQASSVSDLIRLRLEELAVSVYFNHRVKFITLRKDGFSLTTQAAVFEADRVLVATGGQAMPATGSDGSIYRLIRELGHTIIKPLPALVQLMTDFSQLRALAGVKAEARLSLWQGDRPIAEETGELLFADYGVSGPPILQLSRFASPRLDQAKPVILHIDLFPEMERTEVLAMILHQRDRFPTREVQFLLNGIVHKKLIPVLLRQSGQDKMNRPAADVDPAVYERLAVLLTDWTMPVTGTRGFAASQSTLGGLDLREVDHQTMVSRKVPHLYFAGEVLDVCGACGGYNLQWAWSSALAASEAIIADTIGQ